MAQRSGIICAGNWIVDLVHDIEYWPAESELTRIGRQSRDIGGGAANVVAALTKLDTGLPLWPMGAVGDDEYGTFVIERCRGLGLPTNQLAVKAGVATAHTHVMSITGRSRTFFYKGGANDALSDLDFPEGTFRHTGARLFYLGYLTLLGDLDRIGADGTTGSRRILARARQAGLTTCVDLVSVHHAEFQGIVAAAAPEIDYLVLNELEAARATGTETAEDRRTDPTILRHLGRMLLDQGIRQAVVIHCADRVLWSGVDGTVLLTEVNPLPARKIVSHLGAGDAFCAGLLYAVHERWDAGRALRLANSTARASLRGVTASSAIPPVADLMEHD